MTTKCLQTGFFVTRLKHWPFSNFRDPWQIFSKEKARAPTVLLAMTLPMHCPRPRTEANGRCDVSFERPLITSRPRARTYASRERKLWRKKFKIKRFASGCDEIWDSRSIEGKDKLSTDPLTAILGSLDHLYAIYGVFELERSASESPAFPFFLLLVQLKILNVDKTASKWFWRRRVSK